MFGFFFPLAGAFAGQRVQISLSGFVRSLFDVRCMPLLGILTGLALNLSGVSRPDWIAACHVIDFFVLGCTAIMFFVIGLRLHFSQLGEYLRPCLSLAGIKFIASPIAPAILLALARASGVRVGVLPGKVALVEATMPVALFAVVAANLYGLNARLASLLFVANTVMFLVLVLPVIVLVFG